VNAEDRIKLFGMSHALLERELDKLEASQGLDLQRESKDDRDQEYYPQFAQALRTEAAGMARHYELFYCFEKSIRSLVADTLKAAHGETCGPNVFRSPCRITFKRIFNVRLIPE